ncbi:MAG: arsenate reductase ArsC [Thiotrichales bacterium]
MSTPQLNVLFLCTGNSARSIFAEVLLERWGQGKFQSFSAGSDPAGELHPQALRLLRRLGFPTGHLRSKSWETYSSAKAPIMDFVFTVCDKAAAEECPLWPGQPLTAHWGVPDPVAVTGDELTRVNAFRQAFIALEYRIKAFASLPLESLERSRIQVEIEKIGCSHY